MDDLRLEEGEASFRQCPHCTIQISSEEVKCPHCSQEVRPEGRVKKAKTPFKQPMIERRTRVEVKSRRLFVLLALLMGLVLVYLSPKIYRALTGVRVVVSDDSQMKISHVDVVNKGDERIISGVVSNDFMDVPAISLKSIGVRARIVLKSGKTFTRTAFPVGPLGEPGALLMGEDGEFSLSLSGEPAKEVTLKAEVIDLRGKKKFYIPPSRRRSR